MKFIQVYQLDSDIDTYRKCPSFCGNAKIPLREIARRLGISRNTVRRYLRLETTEPTYAERRIGAARVMSAIRTQTDALDAVKVCSIDAQLEPRTRATARGVRSAIWTRIGAVVAVEALRSLSAALRAEDVRLLD